MLSGYGDDVPYGECSGEMLEQAKYNLNKFFIAVGITEKFDESLILFKERLKWKRYPVYLKLRRTPNKPSLNEISKETLQIIEKYNELDIELYEFAKRMFAKAISELPFPIENEVLKLLKLKKLYLPYLKVIYYRDILKQI